MKSLIVHYMNKYLAGRVQSSDHGLDVFNHQGEHVLAMRKNGADQMVCVSEEMGLRDRHDLSPIPKDSRLFKVKDGKIAKDEKHEERKKLVDPFICPVNEDKILSCEDLKAHGFSFDEKQRETEESKASRKAKAATLKDAATLDLQN